MDGRAEGGIAIAEGWADLVCPRCVEQGAGERGLEPRGACARPGCGFVAGRAPSGAPVLVPAGVEGAAYYEDPEVIAQYLAFHYPAAGAYAAAEAAHAARARAGADANPDCDADPDRDADPDCDADPDRDADDAGADADADPLAALLGERAPPLAERFPYAVRARWSQGGRRGGRALDVGCAVGGVTLALAADHDEATGLDLSLALIDAAREVQRNGAARYETVVEGEVSVAREAPIDPAAAARARFLVADALAAPFSSESFDTVTALNLLDRVPDPRRALAECARLVRPGGVLVVASPYTWLERFTPRERWLGGRAGGAGPARGADGVRAALAPRFTLEEEARLPFFIPHHARSGQLGLAVVQTFRRMLP